GQFVLDSNSNLQQVADAEGNAMTAASPPQWPRALGETITDGNITWRCAGPSPVGLSYCSKSNRLELRSMRTGDSPSEDFNTARKMVSVTPMALDQYGNYARWDASSGMVMAGGSGPSDAPPPNEVPIYAPGQPEVTDLVMGYDGVLYIAVGGSLVMIDRRDRWPNFTLNVADFNFWRLAALPEGGVLALDRNAPQLGKVAGQPLQTGPVDTPNPGVLRSCQANSNPPQIIARYALPPTETYVALAPMEMTAHPAQFVLLSWAQNNAGNQAAFTRIFDGLTLSSGPLQLGGVHLPYTIAWLGDNQLAVFATNLNEALVYDLSDSGNTLVPAGETYILAANNVGPMVHGFTLPPNYANVVDAKPLMLPLLPLSLNTLATSAATHPGGPAVIDSGIAQGVWHRMYIEAVVPPRCGAILWLTASDSRADLFDPDFPWYPHILGDADRSSIPAEMLAGAPVAIWQSIATEVPFAPTLLNEDPVQNTQGLFMVLVQRANKAVRNLAGRYLGVRIQLNGDGLNTPQIAGMRIYGPRFSYVQKYLPAIYHEGKFGPDADADGVSTRRDFFERFVNLFESQFTRIEDRIANAYLLMRPESSPGDSLPWLGGWLGIKPNSYPPDRRRARLEATPSLYKWRGTTKAVTEALDVATNGACSRGAIIVIEDFRLRHIFATILGADLAIKDDPLLPGYSGASNSFVGDTLFLGDPGLQAELQALYANELGMKGSVQAVQAFYDKLAYRMTVFVHNQVEDVNLNLVQRIVEAEKPAHVQAFVRVATQAFMIGLASLVGVNTYLGPDRPRNPVTVGSSEVGRYDVVTGTASLDPRMENDWSAAEYAHPIARLNAPSAVKQGDSIVLNGGASASPPGTTITKYQWTLVPPQS
ncbi:MAG TPA: phage tail protein, partial [Terracidiphilus sp.]